MTRFFYVRIGKCISYLKKNYIHPWANVIVVAGKQLSEPKFTLCKNFHILIKTWHAAKLSQKFSVVHMLNMFWALIKNANCHTHRLAHARDSYGGAPPPL